MRTLALLATIASALAAQPAFEVASLKPSLSDGRQEIIVNPGGVTVRNMSLRAIIRWAWEAPRLQLSAPSWTADERFEIIAKVPSPVAPQELRLMMRELLTQRLGVKLHEEKRELSVYFLTVAKNGPRLHEATPKDQTKFQETTEAGDPRFGRNKVLMVADRVRMSDLAEELSDPLQRPVVDRTGLTARYNLILDPTAYMVSQESGEPTTRVDPMSMILTALPAQLGLKVESGKDTVRYWVVDAANKTPSD